MRDQNMWVKIKIEKTKNVSVGKSVKKYADTCRSSIGRGWTVRCTFYVKLRQFSFLYFNITKFKQALSANYRRYWVVCWTGHSLFVSSSCFGSGKRVFLLNIDHHGYRFVA